MLMRMSDGMGKRFPELVLVQGYAAVKWVVERSRLCQPDCVVNQSSQRVGRQSLVFEETGRHGMI